MGAKTESNCPKIASFLPTPDGGYPVSRKNKEIKIINCIYLPTDDVKLTPRHRHRRRRRSNTWFAHSPAITVDVGRERRQQRVRHVVVQTRGIDNQQPPRRMIKIYTIACRQEGASFNLLEVVLRTNKGALRTDSILWRRYRRRPPDSTHY